MNNIRAERPYTDLLPSSTTNQFSTEYVCSCSAFLSDLSPITIALSCQSFTKSLRLLTLVKVAKPNHSVEVETLVSCPAIYVLVISIFAKWMTFGMSDKETEVLTKVTDLVLNDI